MIIKSLTAKLEENEKMEKTSDVNQTSSQKTEIVGSTVVTHVEERSTFDVSRLVADLDARDAELTILRAVLSQKENQVRVWMLC